MMIVYAMIVRANDGLALSATTDFSDEASRSIRDCKRHIKALSKRLQQLPERCTMRLATHSVHFITFLGITYLALCDSVYPTVLAFSFLDDLSKDFVNKYSSRRISEARRPYAFIEFDNYIHKIRQRYNNPRNLTTRVDLSELSQVMKENPPHLLSVSDVTYSVQNGVVKEDTSRITVVAPQRMEPLTWTALVSLVLTVILSFLNCYRGFISLSQSNLEEYDGPSPTHAFLFLLECFAETCQIYVLLQSCRMRKVRAWIAFGAVLGCNAVTRETREWWQSVFHISVAACLHFTTLMRKIESKLPNYNV